MDRDKKDIVITYRGIPIMKDWGLCTCYNCTKDEREAIDKKLDKKPKGELEQLNLFN